MFGDKVAWIGGKLTAHTEGIVARAKEDILDEVGAYDFQSWFEPCRAILVKDTLVIGCPDQAHAGWLMQNYREELTAAIEVRFRVVDAKEFSGYVGGV